MAEFSLAGLLGFQNEDELRKALAQIGPSDEEKSQANAQALMAAGAAMMGARKGQEWQALGNAGLTGLATRTNKLDSILKQRGSDLTQILALRQAAQNAKGQQAFMDAWNGGTPVQLGATMPANGSASAANGMYSALGMPTTAQPTQLPNSNITGDDLESRLNRVAIANLFGVNSGMKDMSAAITAARPPDESIRPGGYTKSRTTGKIQQFPVAPPGYVNVTDPSNPAGFTMIKVPGGAEAAAESAAIGKAVELGYSPQTGVLPGGGEGVVGSKLDAMFHGGPLPWGAPTPFVTKGNVAQQSPASIESPPQSSAASVQPTPQPVSHGPVQTKLSPEQNKNSEAYGDERAAMRTAASQSTKAIGELNAMENAFKYITPGPTLPVRAKVAGVAQEIPLVGRSFADALVPNSATALPAIQAIEKTGVGLTAEQSKIFGSREGQQVIGMIKSAMPNAGQIPGAPETIFNTQRGIHQWIIDKDAAASEWEAKPEHNGSIKGFEEYWNANHPLTSYIPDLPALKNISEGKPPGAPRDAESSGPVTLTDKAKGNATARAMINMALKTKDPAKIKELRDLGWVQ